MEIDRSALAAHAADAAAKIIGKGSAIVLFVIDLDSGAVDLMQRRVDVVAAAQYESVPKLLAAALRQGADVLDGGLPSFQDPDPWEA